MKTNYIFLLPLALIILLYAINSYYYYYCYYYVCIVLVCMCHLCSCMHYYKSQYKNKIAFSVPYEEVVLKLLRWIHIKTQDAGIKLTFQGGTQSPLSGFPSRAKVLALNGPIPKGAPHPQKNLLVAKVLVKLELKKCNKVSWQRLEMNSLKILTYLAFRNNFYYRMQIFNEIHPTILIKKNMN